MKVLVAEDDPVAAEHLAAVLHGMGHEVRAFTNGMDAWKSFDADPTRIIISDWDMPGMDGLAFCRMVRSRPKTEYIYFILITAIHTDEGNYNLAIQSDVDDFLVKPIDRFAIWRRIHVARRILNFATESNRLQMLLPICMHCKKIRDNEQNWQPMEEYINRHTGTDFSHGICPDCAAEFLNGQNKRTPDEIG